MPHLAAPCTAAAAAVGTAAGALPVLAILFWALVPVRLAAQAPGQGGPDPGLEIGEAGYAWSLRSLDGEPFRLDRYRGRLLVLNAWATWCAPCVRELASFEELAKTMEGEDVAFLFVSPESPDRVRAFVRRHGYALPFVVEDQRMPGIFGLEALPTTWIVAPDGRIVLRHRGATDWNTSEVRRLLRGVGSP